MTEKVQVYNVSKEDIRAKIVKWTGTEYVFTTYSLGEIIASVDDFTLFVSFPDSEVLSNTNLSDMKLKFNKEDIYLIENIVYQYLDEDDKVKSSKFDLVMTEFPNDKWDNVFGGLYGTSRAIVYLSNYDFALQDYLKTIKGKFEQVYIIQNKADEVYETTKEIRLVNSIATRISMSYVGLLSLFEERYDKKDFDSLYDDLSFFQYLFPTRTEVPNEPEILNKVYVRQEELVSMGDRENFDQSLVIECTPYLNPYFIPLTMKAFHMFMMMLGVYFANNDPFITDQDLFFENFVKGGRDKIIHSRVTRVIMYLTMMNLRFHHDILVGFAVAIGLKYVKEIGEDTRTIWLNS